MLSKLSHNFLSSKAAGVLKGVQGKALLRNESLRLEYLAGPCVIAMAILFWFLAVKNISGIINVYLDKTAVQSEQSFDIKKIPISRQDYESALQSLKWLASSSVEVKLENDLIVIRQKENLLEFPNWLYSTVLSTTLGKGVLWEVESICVGKCEVPAVIKLKGFRQVVDSKN